MQCLYVAGTMIEHLLREVSSYGRCALTEVQLYLVEKFIFYVQCT